MSISSEITRLQNAKADLKSVLEDNGVIVPANATLDDYPQLVNAASGGIFKLIATKVFNDVPELIDGVTETTADSLETGITPKDYACGMVVVTCDSPITTTNEWGMTVTMFGRYTSNSSIMNSTSVQQKGSATFSFSGMTTNTLCSNSYGVSMPNNIATVKIDRRTHATGCPKVRGGNYTVAVYGLVSGSPSGTPKGLTVDDIALHNIRDDIVLSDDVGMIAHGAFAYYTNITSIVGNGVNKVDISAFEGCNNLQTASFPNATLIAQNAFNGCGNLLSVNVPKAATISGSSLFYNNYQLKSISFPSATSKLGGNSFRFATQLVYCDMGTSAGLGQPQSFSSTNKLSVLVLRRTSAIASLGSTNVFEKDHFSMVYGLGHVYVPRDLIPNYQTATNWSTFYAANPDLFRALEDYTDDGTVTGEFVLSRVYGTHTPVYEVSDVTFNGNAADTVDTNVALFDTDGAFTIIYDVTSANGGNNHPLFECMDISTNLGYRQYRPANSLNVYAYVFNPDGSSTSVQSFDTATHFIGAIICTGKRLYHTTWNTSEKCLANPVTRRTGEVQTHSTTLLIGGGRNADGDYVNGWYGTVHNCKVYKEAIPLIDIFNILGYEVEV